MSKRWKIIVLLFMSFLAGGIVAITALLQRLNDEDMQIDNFMATVVLNGVEMDITNKYKATIIEDMGLMYWEEDSFDMLISIEDGKYNELREDINKEDLTMSDLEGCRELIPFTEIAIDGRSYIFMLYEDSGDLIMYAYSDMGGSISGNKMFQIIVYCYDMKRLRAQSKEELARNCEKLLLISDSVILTARPTDKEDTLAGELYVSDEEYEELLSSISMSTNNEVITEDSLMDDKANTLVTYDVAEGFYYSGELYNINNQPLKIYNNYNDDICAKAYIDYSDLSAKEYISHGVTIWGDENTKMQNISVGVYEFWYYSYSRNYIYEGEAVVENYLVAATKLDKERIYCVMLDTTDKDVDLLEISNKFMNIR